MKRQPPCPTPQIPYLAQAWQGLFEIERISPRSSPPRPDTHVWHLLPLYLKQWPLSLCPVLSPIRPQQKFQAPLSYRIDPPARIHERAGGLSLLPKRRHRLLARSWIGAGGS